MKTTDRTLFWDRLAFLIREGSIAYAAEPAAFVALAPRRLIAEAAREARGINLTGLTDDERLQAARHDNAAIFCPVTYLGHEEQRQLRVKAAVIRNAGKRRLGLVGAA